jgi:GTP-binding protein
MKQNLVDISEFEVKAGSGGRGSVSFRREKHLPKGGPDGGEGGKGGSVRLLTNPNLTTLRFYAGKDRFEAGKGFSGQKRKKYGQDGEDLVLEVPVGTVVKVDATNYRLLKGRQFYGEGAETLKHSGMKVDKLPYLNFEERWGVQTQSLDFDSQNQNLPSELNEVDHYVEVMDLDKPGMEVIIAIGGRGGKGNYVYRSSELTTPKFAQTGERGEKFQVRLELKVLADVGLVGLPNAGKSTLLSVLTAAKPEIADYPFTTLSPNLGVVSFGDPKSDVVIADIPGLIEDAHKGKGLGDEFLRHVERCRVLVYVISPTEELLSKLISFSKPAEETSDSFDQISKEVARELWEQFQVVKGEVERYGHGLSHKEYLVVVNKLDLIAESKTAVEKYFQKKGQKIALVSAATTEGIGELKTKLREVAKGTGDLKDE